MSDAADRTREARERRAVYVISVAAELAGVHPQTLRIYERKGLLPRVARTAVGYRRYSAVTVERVTTIAPMRRVVTPQLVVHACCCVPSAPRN